MKKISLIVACVGLAGSAAMAADPVYSVNAVGYVKKAMTANAYRLMGAPFAKVNGGNAELTASDVFGVEGIPDNTKIYLWDGTDYVPETFYEGYGWDPNTTLISRSDGFWMTTSLTTDIVLSGEVPSAAYAANTATALAQGYQLITFPYPSAISLTNTVLSTLASDNDKIYVWDGTDYVPYTYYDGYGWDPSDLVVQPGDGYWYYRAGSSVVWNETKPYQWP